MCFREQNTQIADGLYPTTVHIVFLFEFVSFVYAAAAVIVDFHSLVGNFLAFSGLRIVIVTDIYRLLITSIFMEHFRDFVTQQTPSQPVSAQAET